MNALDGVAESDGRIVFMTTNYLDRLDPALVRPGRVDFKQYIGHATQYQAENMFLKFYPEANPATAQAFAAKLMASNIKASAAQIQGYLMLYKNQPVVAYENIEHFESNLKNTATSHLVKWELFDSLWFLLSSFKSNKHTKRNQNLANFFESLLTRK